MRRRSSGLPVVILAIAGVLATGAVAAASDEDAGGLFGAGAPGEGRVAAAADCTGALFCENFDALAPGAADSPNWRVDAANGTLRVEAEGAAGNQVLRVQTTDNGRAFLVVEDFAAPGNSFFGRMRLRVREFPSAPDFAHFVLVEATGSGSTEIVRPVGGQFIPPAGPGSSRWGVGADGGPTGDWTDHRESAPTVDDTWQCIEWQLAAEDNRMALTIDGVPNPELVASTDVHGGNQVPFILPAVDTVKIGWQVFQTGTTPAGFDVFIDDLALSGEPLGC